MIEENNARIDYPEKNEVSLSLSLPRSNVRNKTENLFSSRVGRKIVGSSLKCYNVDLA